MADPSHIRQVYDRYSEMVNKGDVEGILELYTDDATVEDPIGSEVRRGSDEVRRRSAAGPRHHQPHGLRRRGEDHLDAGVLEPRRHATGDGRRPRLRRNNGTPAAHQLSYERSRRDVVRSASYEHPQAIDLLDADRPPSARGPPRLYGEQA